MFKFLRNYKVTMKEVVDVMNFVRDNLIFFKNHNGFELVSGKAISYEEIFIERTPENVVTIYEENQGICFPLCTSENMGEKIVAHPKTLKKIRKLLSELNKLGKVA